MKSVFGPGSSSSTENPKSQENSSVLSPAEKKRILDLPEEERKLLFDSCWDECILGPEENNEVPFQLNVAEVRAELDIIEKQLQSCTISSEELQKRKALPVKPGSAQTRSGSAQRDHHYDYLFKIILVGDSGKNQKLK